MNDLSGRCVNIALTIESGRGLGFIQYPIKIIANFNGRPLESDLVDPDDNPTFTTELVWETEKKELRKLRSANAPVRIDVTTDNNHRKDRIGFVLLSPRSACVIPLNSKLQMPLKWHKLLGVAPEHKNSRPELYLSLVIRDLGLKEPLLSELTIEEEAEAIIEPQFEKDGKVVPIQYLQNGYIQIGENCNEKYALTTVIQVAYNLDLLLPEVLVFNQNREKYFISLRLFGVTIKTKPFCRDLHANIAMNEKINIRIISEYDILQTYFSEYCEIVMCFFCGSDKLGMTKLKAEVFLQNMDEEEFISRQYISRIEQKCFFKFPSDHGIVPRGTNDRRPYIEVETTLKRIEMQPLPVDVYEISSTESIKVRNIEIVSTSTAEFTTMSEITTTAGEGMSSFIDSETEYKQNISSQNEENESNERLSLGKNEEIEEEPISQDTGDLSSREVTPCHDGDKNLDYEEQNEKEEVMHLSVGASGDQNELSCLELNDERITKPYKRVNSLQNLTERSEVISETCKSEDSVLKNVPPLSPIACIRKVEDLSRQVCMYQQYCLDVILENIILKRQIKSNKLYIKFKHPKASSVTTIVAEIYDHIGEYIILENSRCKMFFVSSLDHIRKMVYAWPPKLVLADENDQPLTEELDIYTAMFLAKNRTECSYITECKALRTYEPLAKISVMMYLQEYGLSALPKPTDYDLLPQILDENIAVKELQDLQEWKDIEKMQFSADLKILEKQRMANLRKDWSKKKKQLEEKLSKSVARCEKLSRELQTSINTVRTKKELEKKESELGELSNRSLQDVVEKNTQKYTELNKMELILTISKSERENENLKGIINDQRHEMQQIKKTALTKEQTTNLLQQLRGLEEKFEEAQKTKTYFKDQWKRAVREIHDLKSEDQKKIQEKIQSQKIELSQLSLDNFLPDNINAKFDFTQNPFAVATSGSVFGGFKWDPTSFSDETSASASRNCNDNT